MVPGIGDFGDRFFGTDPMGDRRDPSPPGGSGSPLRGVEWTHDRLTVTVTRDGAPDTALISSADVDELERGRVGGATQRPGRGSCRTARGRRGDD